LNCPHCNSPNSKVTETRPCDGYDKRVRICRDCSSTYRTIERVAVYAGRAAGYFEAGGSVMVEADDDEVAPEPEAKPAAKAKPPAKAQPAAIKEFYPVVPGDELNSVCEEARPLLVEWWNNSRRSKHQKNATWTTTAWFITVKRVAALPMWQQVLLAQAGVEHGWQTLKLDYIKTSQPPQEAGLVPKSTAMQEAINRWNLPSA